MNPRQRPCKFCSSIYHWPYQCAKNPKIKKPIKKVGKVAKATNAAVAAWKRTQKPNHQGYYECYYCGVWVTYLEGEHTLSKARHPDQRTNKELLVIACSKCNDEKRSKDYIVDKS